MSGYFIDVIAGPAAGSYLLIKPQQTRIIGRSRACDLPLADDLVSAQHLLIKCGRGVEIEDLRSTNGTKLLAPQGTRRISDSPTQWPEEALLEIGSHLLQLRPANTTAALLTPAPATEANAPASRPQLQIVQLSPPLPRPPLPPDLGDPPNPPKSPPPRRIPWVAMATSALGGVIMAAVFRMAFMLIFSILAPTGMLAQHLWEKRRSKREHHAKLIAHEAAIQAHQAEQRARHQARARLERLAAPDPAASCRASAVPTVELWQDTAQALSEGQLLLGFIRDDDAHRPFTVPIGAGPVGIYGPEPDRGALLRWIAAFFATRYAPGTTQITGAARWLGDLPHQTDRAQQVFLLSANTSAPDSEADTVFEVIYALTRAELPARCTRVLAIASGFSARWEDLTTDEVTQIDKLCGISAEQGKKIAQDLSVLRDKDALPPVFRSLESIWRDPTPRAIADQWQTAATTPGALCVPIGQNRGGEVINLDLVAGGPHLLIGGTTGSGKSVLQRALILSLALTQRPEHLALVLIDFKGGAAFRCLSGLPHVIDTVTDLDAGATVRTLESLRAELRRREELLARHGYSDHDRLAGAGLIDQAPRLVIVIDELRALSDEHPELLAELVALAALGRSLGMHLVLATQRPGSVVNADMRANLNARIALRVQSGADSHDILDADDAASLPIDQPGAAVLRLGSSAGQHFQVADCTDIQAAELTAKIASAARGLGAEPPRRPWLTALPKVIENLPDYVPQNYSGPPAVGVCDLPQQMKQLPLQLGAPGMQLLIAGGSGSGRTSTLRAIARFADAPVHVIAREPELVVDTRAPWVGTVVNSRDQRLILRLIDRLLGQPAHRRFLLIDDADLLIDPENMTGKVWPALQDLMRRGSEHHISVALAGGRMLLGTRVSELASARWFLNWADETAQLLVGVPRGATPPAGPGGIVVHAGQESVAGRIFWVAPPSIGSWASSAKNSPSTKSASGTALAAEIPHNVVRLHPLPDRVEPKDLAGSRPPSQLPLGLGGDLATVLTVETNRPFAVVGSPGSGRTTVLRLLAQQASQRGLQVLVLTGGMQMPSCSDTSDMPSTLHFVQFENAASALREPHNRDAIILIDDLDIALNWDPHADWVTELRDRVRQKQTVIAAATTNAWAASYSGLLAEIRRYRSGVILQAHQRGSNDIFGIDVERWADVPPPPPGRGVLVTAGTPTALQVAQTDQWFAPKQRA